MRFRSDPATIRGSIAPVKAGADAVLIVAVARMYQHREAGEFDKARDPHFGLHPMKDVIFTETNPAAATWVPAQSGPIGSGFVRPPLAPHTEAGQAKVRELLRQGLAVLGGPVGRMADGGGRSGE